MKNLLPLIIAILLFSACNNKADTSAETEADSLEVTPARMVWQSDLDSTGRIVMKQVPGEGSGELTVEGVVQFLNETNPNIQLSYSRTSGDTVYLRIADPTYLTQRMGSSGPDTYLATVVYNFTDLPGINYVNLDFEEGDHAMPGTFTRETFSN